MDDEIKFKKIYPITEIKEHREKNINHHDGQERNEILNQRFGFNV